MNSYEQKQAAQKARFEQLATQAKAQSISAQDRAREMAAAIPFGQPILIGHHSENRDRNYRNRIGKTFDKAHQLSDKSEHYKRKAQSVGTGGISSDDPAAIEKLTQEVDKLEQRQERMKKVNQVIRQRAGDYDSQHDGLLALGWLTNEQAHDLLQGDFAGRVGYASYALTNNNSSIRRIRGRIAELERNRSRKTVAVEVEREENTYTYREDTEENRVMFVFAEKPDDQVRQLLTSHSFKWSPSRSAWVRKLTPAGIYHGQLIHKALSEPSTSHE